MGGGGVLFLLIVVVLVLVTGVKQSQLLFLRLSLEFDKDILIIFCSIFSFICNYLFISLLNLQLFLD